jgi:hypothetical protein
MVLTLSILGVFKYDTMVISQFLLALLSEMITIPSLEKMFNKSGIGDSGHG